MSDLSHQSAFRLIYKRRRTEAEEEALQNHLQTCPECRQDAQMAGLFGGHLLLDSLPTRPSPQFSAVYREQAARRSRRSHIMKPIYAVGGAAALALLMLAGWYIIRSNIQTTGLVEAPQLPAISVPESQSTARPAAAEESVLPPDAEIDLAVLDENLIAAVETGDAAAVEELLNSGANPEVVGNKGIVPLPLAAGAGNLEIVQLLLAAGADVNSTMDGKIGTGHTVAAAPPLFHAAAAGHLDVVELLLANGADPNQTETVVGIAPIHEAARMNYVEIVQLLLAHGADVNLQGTRGDTPLYWAVLRPSIESAEALLEAGANGNIQELEEGKSPLMASLLDKPFGPPELISLLLDHGTNPDIQDKTGNTALHYAAFDGDGAIVEMLLTGGASIDLQNNGGMTALHRAAVGNRAQVVKVLIEHGASVDIEDNEGQTALDVASGESQELLREAEAESGSVTASSALDEQLIAAVEAGDSTEVEQLLNSGMDPNFVDNLGKNSLPLAAGAGDLEIIQLLLDAGADVNSTMDGSAPDDDTFTEAPALLHAATEGHLDVVNLLLANGANPNQAETQEGDVPLHHAAWFNYPDIVNALIDNGAKVDVRRKTSEGSTPLHWAISSGSLEATEALVLAGADVNLEDLEWFRTPLLWVIRRSPASQIEMVNLLTDHGANPDAQDKLGESALHYAATKGNTDFVEILLDKGTSIDLQNNNGKTALHRAAEYNQTKVVEVLIEHGASLDIEDNEGRTPLDVATYDTIKEILREAGAQ